MIQHIREQRDLPIPNMLNLMNRRTSFFFVTRQMKGKTLPMENKNQYKLLWSSFECKRLKETLLFFFFCF